MPAALPAPFPTALHTALPAPQLAAPQLAAPPLTARCPCPQRCLSAARKAADAAAAIAAAIDAAARVAAAVDLLGREVLQGSTS